MNLEKQMRLLEQLTGITMTSMFLVKRHDDNMRELIRVRPCGFYYRRLKKQGDKEISEGVVYETDLKRFFINTDLRMDDKGWKLGSKAFASVVSDLNTMLTILEKLQSSVDQGIDYV